MDRPHYNFKYSRSNRQFYFISKGKKGKIKKVVQFRLIHDRVFNLGFSDWSEETQDFDDKAVSENGDMQLVLATVIKIMCLFLSENEGMTVFLTGSTPARTRLYQIIINTNLNIIKDDFEISGFREGHWCQFEKNVNYESFTVSKLL